MPVLTVSCRVCGGTGDTVRHPWRSAAPRDRRSPVQGPAIASPEPAMPAGPSTDRHRKRPGARRVGLARRLAPGRPGRSMRRRPGPRRRASRRDPAGARPGPPDGPQTWWRDRCARGSSPSWVPGRQGRRCRRRRGQDRRSPRVRRWSRRVPRWKHSSRAPPPRTGRPRSHPGHSSQSEQAAAPCCQPYDQPAERNAPAGRGGPYTTPVDVNRPGISREMGNLRLTRRSQACGLASTGASSGILVGTCGERDE